MTSEEVMKIKLQVGPFACSMVSTSQGHSHRWAYLCVQYQRLTAKHCACAVEGDVESGCSVDMLFQHFLSHLSAHSKTSESNWNKL